MRETAGLLRLGVAFAYDQAWPRPQIEVPNESAEEDTNSGLPSSSEEASIPWASFHAQFNNSPVYRPDQVEEAFELWLMCHRPFGQEFDRVLYSRGLLEIEIRALRAVIEYYYMTSPRSSGSATPPPQTLVSEMQPYQVENVESIVRRMRDHGEILVDSEGAIWAGPLRSHSSLPSPRMDPASSSTDPSPALPPTHRVTRRDWGTILTIADDELSVQQPASSSEVPSLTPHDYVIVEAAVTLLLEGYQFDWQQLNPEQKELYHARVGQYMCSLHEVD